MARRPSRQTILRSALATAAIVNVSRTWEFGALKPSTLVKAYEQSGADGARMLALMVSVGVIRIEGGVVVPGRQFENALTVYLEMMRRGAN